MYYKLGSVWGIFPDDQILGECTLMIHALLVQLRALENYTMHEQHGTLTPFDSLSQQTVLWYNFSVPVTNLGQESGREANPLASGTICFALRQGFRFLLLLLSCHRNDKYT
jgi:hypothetical protein